MIIIISVFQLFTFFHVLVQKVYRGTTVLVLCYNYFHAFLFSLPPALPTHENKMTISVSTVRKGKQDYIVHIYIRAVGN